MFTTLTDDYLKHLNILQTTLFGDIEKLQRRTSEEVSGGNDIYFLQSGVAFIANSMTQQLITVLHAPAIVGLSSLFGVEDNNLHCHLDQRCVVYSVPVEDAKLKILNASCLDSVATVMAYNFTRTINSLTSASTNQGGYPAVKKCIESVNELDPVYKNQISLVLHIQQRTNLSRGYVMKILKELKRGEYIDISRGRLININRPLPSRF